MSSRRSPMRRRRSRDRGFEFSPPRHRPPTPPNHRSPPPPPPPPRRRSRSSSSGPPVLRYNIHNARSAARSSRSRSRSRRGSRPSHRRRSWSAGRGRRSYERRRSRSRSDTVERVHRKHRRLMETFPCVMRILEMPSRRNGGTAEEELLVPEVHVGKLIGSGGACVKDIEDWSGCRILVAKDGSDRSDPPVRKVNLRGRPRHVMAARDVIFQKLRLWIDATKKGSGPADSAARAGSGEVKTLLVPEEHISKLIGKRGSCVKDVQQWSGCKIDIGSESEVEGSGRDAVRPIVLRGTPSCISAARDVIFGKLEEWDFVSGRRMRLESDEPITVLVPEEHVAKLIGAKGACVKELQTKSRCKIDIQPEEQTEQKAGVKMRPIRIAGSADDMEAARALVLGKVDDWEDADRRKSGVEQDAAVEEPREGEEEDDVPPSPLPVLSSDALKAAVAAAAKACGTNPLMSAVAINQVESLRDYIETVLHNELGGPCLLYVVGGWIVGASEADSPLDLVASSARLRPRTGRQLMDNLRQVLRALQRDTFKDLVVSASPARVAKTACDPHSDRVIDNMRFNLYLSTDRLWMSGLTVAYFSVDSAIPLLARALKAWARELGAHRSGMLSSVVVTVLVLFFVVRKQVVEWVDPARIDTARAARSPLQLRWSSSADMQAAGRRARELLPEMLRFYSTFPFDTDVVSLAADGPVQRGPAHSSGAVWVEHPRDAAAGSSVRNLAKGVDAASLDVLKQAFAASADFAETTE